MKYQMILKTVHSQPWAIWPDKLAEICQFLALKDGGEDIAPERVAEVVQMQRDQADSRKSSAGMAAVIPVLGTIINRETGISQASGLATVERIRADLREALEDPDVGSVVLDIDSPGGTAEGIPELAADIRRARERKPVFASVNGMGASAAYYLASQATRISMTESSQVGSIGVVMAHQDWSKMMDEKGIKVSLISAGKYKAEGNRFEPLGKEARAEMQSSVDYYYNLFVKDVGRGRGVTSRTVEENFGQGRLVRADTAIRRGMVDAIEDTETTITEAILAAADRQKKAASFSTVREFELFLRDAGLSRGEAKRVAAVGFPAIDDQRDAGQEIAAFIIEKARELATTGD